MSTRGNPGKPGRPAPGNMGDAPGWGGIGPRPAAEVTGTASTFLSVSLAEEDVVGGVGTPPRKGADPCL